MNEKQSNKVYARESGIELLKIVGMFLIVISHVTGTLSYYNQYITYHDYNIDLNVATMDFQQLILSILNYSGAIGNNIFLYVLHGF
jgi:hypothetical protein